MSEFENIKLRTVYFFIQYSISAKKKKKNVTLRRLNVDIYLQSVHLNL